MGMDERKFKILQAIIDDYILTAVPVALLCNTACEVG